MKKQHIKIIMANDDIPEEIEKKLNDLTEQGYKLQSSKVDWYCGTLEDAREQGVCFACLERT